jgi:hypothetical protein
MDLRRSRTENTFNVSGDNLRGRRRIPDLATLRREARAWTRRLNHARTRINWRFDRRAARRKFGHAKHFSKRSEI